MVVGHFLHRKEEKGREERRTTAVDQLVSFFLSKKTKEYSRGIVARNTAGKVEIYNTIVNWCCLAPPLPYNK